MQSIPILNRILVHVGRGRLGHLLVVSLLFVSPQAFAQSPIDFTRTFHGNNEPVALNFRAWMPPDLNRVRGVVFNLPGIGGDSRSITSDPVWRGRLASMGFAVVGVQFSYAPIWDWQYWGTYAQEISANMDNLLGGMATAFGRPEINNAPMIIEGFSHGAFGAHNIAEAIPGRVLGYIADKDWDFLDGNPADWPAISQVPALLLAGANDNVIHPMQVYSTFASRRNNIDARIALQVDWTGHQPTTHDARFAFIDQVLRTRYPAGQLPSTTPGQPMQAVNIPLSDGWVGEKTCCYPYPISGIVQKEWPEIAPAVGFQYVDGPAGRSWLLNETMAKVYRAHDAVPAGISLNALTLAVTNAVDGSVNGNAPIQLSVSLTEIPYTGIDIFHENELIAHLNYSSGQQNISYTPTETGIHTFIAVAAYLYNGQTHYTSKYTTVGVLVVPGATGGDYNQDGEVGAADYIVWRKQNGSAQGFNTWRSQFGIGTGGDYNLDSAFDAADYVVWRKQSGNLEGYNRWRSKFGLQKPGFGSSAVPEPENLLTLLIAAAAALLRSRSFAPMGVRHVANYDC